MPEFAGMMDRPAGEAEHAHAAARRRITADSFRSLTARLRKEPLVPDLIPDLLPVARPVAERPEPAVVPPPPMAVAEAQQPVAAPVPDLPAFEPLSAHEAEAVAIPADQAPIAYAEPAPVDAPDEIAALEPLPDPVVEPQPDPLQDIAAQVFAEPPSAVIDVAPAEEAVESEPAFPQFPDFAAWEPLAPPAEEAESPAVEAVEAVESLEAVAEAVEAQPLEEPIPAPVVEEALEEAASPIAAAAPDFVEQPDPLPEETPAVEAAPEVAEAPVMADVVLPDPGVAVPGSAPEVQAAPAPVVQRVSTFDAAPAESEAHHSMAPRAASPLANKVVEALVKTVTEAVYARPSALERAAFLREVADLVERDLAAESAGGEVAVAAAALAEPAPVVQAPAEPPPVASKAPPSLLRKQAEADDPFAQAVNARLQPPKPQEMPEADEDSGELALSLLEMMSGGSASSQPQERALAADTLLRLLPRIPVRQLLSVSERIAMMETPPSLLVAKLLRDPRPEIVSPLLERCIMVSDHDLMQVATEGDVHKQRMLARRRALSPVLADVLIGRGDPSVLLTLVRNPGVALNHEAFYKLAEHAVAHETLLAPLTTRADLPAPVAFELFWHVPQELRRFIFSRFLTDSENLNKILKITLATQGGDGAAQEAKFAAREAVDAVIAKAAEGAVDTAAGQLAGLAGIAHETAVRILMDGDGEPLAVVLKAIGYPRSKFGEAVELLQKSDGVSIRPGRKLEDVQSIFDTLSFNKARILLTYWDWFITKSGPYAPAH